MPRTDAATRLIQTALLGEAIDGAPVAVFVADESMRYVAVNAYAAARLGYTRDELLALSVVDVARHDDAPLEFAALEHDGQLDNTAVLTCKDGSRLRFRYRAGRTTTAHQDVFVAVGTLEPAEG